MDIEDPVLFVKELHTLLNDKIFKKKLILWLKYSQSLYITEITKQIEMPRTTVYSVLKRWKDVGSIEDDEGRGRKSSLSI